MKKNDLQEAIRNVDRDLVEEAGGGKWTRKKWVKLGVSAACIVLAAAVAVPAILLGTGNKKPAPIKPTVPPKGPEGYADGEIAGRYYRGEEGISVPYSREGDEAELAYSKSDGASDTIIAGEKIEPMPEFSRNELPEAGLLTAKEWKDLKDLAAWKKQILDNQWYAIAERRRMFSDSVIRVLVTDGDNVCVNAKVSLMENDQVLFTGRTNIDGEVFLAYNIDKKTENPTAVSVLGQTFPLDGKQEITVNVKGAPEQARELDLMLMVDTTGSMGDELNYLKAELKDMVMRIAEKDQALSLRTSVNFYRDESDQYVVRYFDFRGDIDECLTLIGEQNAEGGGDYPEAVHTALDNAVSGHQWRENAVKICFFVLDAPPHAESEIQGINAQIVKSLRDAAELGIRIVPVMCSGAQEELEYVLRSFAVLTGGTFLYLTDDSGIGLGHLDPTVNGDPEVEPLNECMIRVVCEACGLEYTKPAPKVQDRQ